MVATIVTHMMIALNNHIGRTPNTNATYKKAATIQQFENVTELKYKSVIEQEQTPPAGASTFQYNLNESAITISETSLTRLKKASRTINEPAKTITETSLVHKGVHTITEPAASITEGLTKQRIATRTLSEPSTSIGESIQKAAKRIKTITEGATAITEGLISNRHFTKTLTPESTTITETSLTKVAKKVRLLIETPIDTTESLTKLRSVSLTESPITITEALVRSRLFSFQLYEQSYTSPSFSLNSFLSTIPITESLSHTPLHVLSESTAITESLQAVRRVIRTITENVPVGPGSISKLVNHILTENVVITESLVRSKIIKLTINEDPIPITESLSSVRYYQRVINPDSFSPDSFTKGAFESFGPPTSEDVVTITEELEAFVLPPGQKVIIEDPTVITESLVALKIPAMAPPVVGGGGGGGHRRRRRSYPPLYQRRTVLEKPLELIREPVLYQFELTEPGTQITEALSSTKIITRIKTETISVAAAAPPPQIIEKTVYVDRIEEKEKLVEIQPPPIIRAQDVIVSKPRPIETKQEILVSTQSHSNKIKSKAASAQLQMLQELMILSQLEEMV